LDRDSTQIYICEEDSSSSFLITTSYHDLIGFAEEIADASSFVRFWYFLDFGDLDFVYGSLPLSLDLDLGGIKTYFGGILWLGNQEYNLYLLLYILYYQIKKITIKRMRIKIYEKKK